MAGRRLHPRFKARQTTSRCVALVMALLISVVPLVAGDGGQKAWANEYQLKAAFIYKLMAFVDLPPVATRSRIIVGFAGDGAMMPALESSLRGIHIGTLPVDVRQTRTDAEMKACDIIVVDYPDASRVRETLSRLKDARVLTIGHGEDFVRMGGVISLVPHDNTFQIAINTRAAARAEVRVSSKLLAIARLVEGDLP